jgi:two-component system NarL family sensor kinase
MAVQEARVPSAPHGKPTTPRGGRRRSRGKRPITVRRAVTQFAVSGLVAVVALSVLGFVLLRETGTREAIREAKTIGELAALGIVEPYLTPAFARGDPAALAELDRVIEQRVLTAGVVRVKIWDADGRIVYSDEDRLVGRRFRLGEHEREALANPMVKAELSDLTEPENRYERGFGKLLEVYLPIRTTDGRRLVFEAYKRFSSVTASGQEIWRSFAVPAGIIVVLLALAQVPLAWSMARRQRESQLEREILLHRALAASDDERRRIAGSLHDGVVQDLTGISYSLSAAARRLPSGAEEPAASLERAAQSIRQSIRRLRSVLVDIYPPDLRRSGLAAALADLVAAAQAEGARVSAHVPVELELGARAERVLFRVAQEGLTNVTKHARAEHVELGVEVRDGLAILGLQDDGRGFEPGRMDAAAPGEHLGLRMLRDLAEDAGGFLAVTSAPGEGTTVRVEVPAD